MFTKFLQDAKGSSRMKVCHPFCDPPNSCRMPAHRDCDRVKTGCVNFSQYTRHKSIIIATSLERAVTISIYYYKAHYMLYTGTLVKTTKTCVFLPMCTRLPPAISPKDIRGYWTVELRLVRDIQTADTWWQHNVSIYRASIASRGKTTSHPFGAVIYHACTKFELSSFTMKSSHFRPNSFNYSVNALSCSSCWTQYKTTSQSW